MLWIICCLVAAGFAKEIAVTPFSDGGISGALLNATENDVVTLAVGEYSGPENCDLVIGKNNVSLVGKQGVTIDCRLQSRCLSILNVTGVRVFGISFKNGQAAGTTTLRHRAVLRGIEESHDITSASNASTSQTRRSHEVVRSRNFTVHFLCRVKLALLFSIGSKGSPAFQTELKLSKI